MRRAAGTLFGFIANGHAESETDGSMARTRPTRSTPDAPDAQALDMSGCGAIVTAE